MMTLPRRCLCILTDDVLHFPLFTSPYYMNLHCIVCLRGGQTVIIVHFSFRHVTLFKLSCLSNYTESLSAPVGCGTAGRTAHMCYNTLSETLHYVATAL